MTSSNGNISALFPLYAGNHRSSVVFPNKGTATWTFNFIVVVVVLSLNNCWTTTRFTGNSGVMTVIWLRRNDRTKDKHNKASNDDGVMTRTHYPYCWPFVRGIHWLPVDSHHKGSVMQSFDGPFAVNLDMLWTSRVVVTMSRIMWRYRNVCA